MRGVPKIKVARPGEDVRRIASKDFSLNTDNSIQKFYRNVRSTSSQTIKHGLTYDPVVYFLKEINETPKRIGHTLDGGYTQGDDLRLVRGTHTPYWTGSFDAPVNDAATIAYLAIDPVDDTTGKILRKLSNPRIRVGLSPNDFDKSLDSFYDSLKVHSTGKLTLSLPQWTANNITDVDKRSVTYTHNLGYVPFFAPFVPYETSLTTYYGWLYQWHDRGSWTTATEYIPLDNVDEGADFYECLIRHTSSSATRPGSGAQWTTYWKKIEYDFDQFYPDTIDLNALEDVKIVFGGVGGFLDVVIRVWATSTQLVIEAERWADTTWGSVTMKAQTITMDYTVFFNRVDEEFNLLEN